MTRYLSVVIVKLVSIDNLNFSFTFFSYKVGTVCREIKCQRYIQASIAILPAQRILMSAYEWTTDWICIHKPVPKIFCFSPVSFFKDKRCSPKENGCKPVWVHGHFGLPKTYLFIIVVFLRCGLFQYETMFSRKKCRAGSNIFGVFYFLAVEQRFFSVRNYYFYTLYLLK